MITAPTNRSTRSGTAGTAGSAGSTGTSAPQATAPGGAMGKNQFLKLLIAQMQNQDPMSPMQGDQMAAQLAQFSSLEQLQQINDSLAGQASSSGSLLGAIQSNAAINTIGHGVVAVGNQVQIGGASGATSVTADFANAGATATLHIYDANGREVGARELGANNGGRHTFDIAGAADGLPDGNYTYGITVKDAAGDPVNVTTYTTGKVTGVSTGQNGLVLNVGGLTIPYATVVQVVN